MPEVVLYYQVTGFSGDDFICWKLKKMLPLSTSKIKFN
jgi:hypothetical protein